MIVTTQEVLDFLKLLGPQLIVDAAHDIINVKRDAIAAAVQIPQDAYYPDDLATAIQDTLNSNVALSDNGSIHFVVTYDSITYKFRFAIEGLYTISYVHIGSSIASVVGLLEDKGPDTYFITDEPVEDTVTVVEQIHKGVEAWVENVKCHRKFNITEYEEYRDGNESDSYYLKNYPVTTITQILYNDVDITANIISDLEVGEVYYKNTIFKEGRKNIFSKYKSGYAIENMPEDLKLAVKMTVEAIYERHKQGTLGVSSYQTGELKAVFQNEAPAQANAIFTAYKRRLF
jgi:hypothetical protein